MSTTETPTGVEPAKGALETPPADWNRFQDLGKELGDEPEVAAVAAPASPETKAEPEVKADPTAQPPADAADDDLTRLDEFLKKTEEPPAAPAVETKTATAATPELQQVQVWANDPELAKTAFSYAQGFHQLNDAMNRGDVAGALKQFAPQAQDAIKEHFYQSHKDEFVERFVAESTGAPQPKPDPRINQLEDQVRQMASMLTARQKDEMSQREMSQAQARQQAFEKRWDDLFAQVRVTDPDDKEALQGWIMKVISKDPKASRNVQEGRLGPINAQFRELYPKWKDKRKAALVAESQARDKQEDKKSSQLVTSAATTTGDPSAQEPDIDAETGKRTQSFWKRNLSKIKGWDE